MFCRKNLKAHSRFSRCGTPPLGASSGTAGRYLALVLSSWSPPPMKYKSAPSPMQNSPAGAANMVMMPRPTGLGLVPFSTPMIPTAIRGPQPTAHTIRPSRTSFERNMPLKVSDALSVFMQEGYSSDNNCRCGLKDSEMEKLIAAVTLAFVTVGVLAANPKATGPTVEQKRICRDSATIIDMMAEARDKG